MIKAIVFDLGNVIFTNDYAYSTPSELTDFCNYFGTEMDNLETAFSVFFNPYSLGKMTEDEYWDKFLYTARAKKMDIEAAKKTYRRNQKEKENMLDLVKNLKKKYRLGILSTIPKEWFDFKNEKFELSKYFEVIIASGYEGHAKPEPIVYKKIVEKFWLLPKEILFIDDKESLLPEAKKIGIQTLLFRGQKDLEANLEKLGVL